MRHKDAVAGEFDRIAADHDIEQQAAVAQPVERCGLPRREGRRDHAGAQRDKEFQPLGMRRKARRGDPGILAILAGRQQHAGKAEPVDRLGDLLEVAELRRPLLLLGAEIAAVAMGRDEPEEVERLLGFHHIDRHQDFSLASGWTWSVRRRDPDDLAHVDLVGDEAQFSKGVGDALLLGDHRVADRLHVDYIAFRGDRLRFEVDAGGLR